jgi:disulfide bond formation protein DsbB
MTFMRRLGATSVALALMVGGSWGGVAHASTATPSAGPPLRSLQTVQQFLRIAYTWKEVWYHGEPSIGKRDAPYTATVLDEVLKHVVIGPETDANKTNWIVGTTKEVSSTHKAGGVIAYEVAVRIDGSFTVDAYAHVKKIGGVWKTVGAYLPTAAGPTRYCVDSPAAASYCRIYPPGSE